MSLTRRAVHAAATRLARRGFELRRHPAVRRQQLFASHGVDLVLDVGASHGGFGRQLREFGYAGSIISFEPQSGPFATLSESARADARWEARRLGAGSEPGEAVINVASNSTSSSILPMLDAHVEAAPHVTYVGQETIQVVRLDDEVLTEVRAATAPFLKIDTQGFEREVLAGASDVLAACVGLQLELSLTPLYGGGMLIDEAVSWAYQHGFRLAVVEQGYASPSGQILQIDGVFLRERAVVDAHQEDHA